MSFSQGIQTTTGIATEGNVDVHRDVNINIITTAHYTTAAEIPRVWRPFCTVPAPIPYFAGREELIAQIHRQVQQCSLESEYSKKIVVIYGLGGMGKSELVRKYVQMYRQNPIILNAAWINAGSKNSLEISFKSLAEELHLQTKDKEVKDVVSSIYNFLAEHSQSSLFIFDNAEQMRSEDNAFGIFDFLPTGQLDAIPIIIITTRVNNWEIPENPENSIQINELTEDAGLEFLTKRFRLSPKQEQDKKIIDALKDFAQNLQCFPLSLTLAASNIPISKLRSIPKEIKEYIQKLKNIHGDWIKEQHSTGTASKYDLIMSNVWAATLDKIQSHGQDGESAISILKLMAYFPPDQITVEDVVECAEFSGLPTSTACFEMLECYSLIYLPSSTYDYNDFQDKRSDSEDIDSDDGTHQDIRIHRLVQRCTRDKLDREKNYTYLLNVSTFLAHPYLYVFNRRAIHEHLKERMWPENSIQFSILFCAQELGFEPNFEILKDIQDALILKETTGYAHNLTEDYKILHALHLFYVSTYSRDYNTLCESLLSKDPSYSKTYLEQVFVSSLGKCVKVLFMGSMHMEHLVKKASINLLTKILAFNGNELTRSQQKMESLRYHHHCYIDRQITVDSIANLKVQEEISLMLADATGNAFEGSVKTVGLLYNLFWSICRCYSRIPVSWYVKSVLKIHSSVYTTINKSGGDRLWNYWEFDQPIPYHTILKELKDNSNVEWTRCFVESFSTEAGLQFLLQHLQYLNALTQTMIYNLPSNAGLVLEFITFLGWKLDCKKEFIQANLFMETLYSITKNSCRLNVQNFYKIRCLLTWYSLLGTNTCVDCSGISWSIQSVEKEMILWLDTLDSTRSLYIFLNWDAKAILKEFMESSGSEQESIAVKTAADIIKEYLSWWDDVPWDCANDTIDKPVLLTPGNSALQPDSIQLQNYY